MDRETHYLFQFVSWEWHGSNSYFSHLKIPEKKKNKINENVQFEVFIKQKPYKRYINLKLIKYKESYKTIISKNCKMSIGTF